MRVSRLVFTLLLSSIIAACKDPNPHKGPQVIVYTNIDRSIAEPILKKARGEVRVKVIGVYESEGVNVVQQLAAKKNAPEADLFWSIDPGHALLLKKQGVTAACESPGGRNILELYKDPERHWVGLSARAMVLLANNELVPRGNEPASVLQLSDAQWRGRIAMANPLQGMTAYFVAALFESLGEDQAKAWLEGLRANQVKIFPTEIDVKRQVTASQFAIGLLDSSNAIESMEHKHPARMTIPDQSAAAGNPLGALIIPNTVSLINRGPNTTGARPVFDYLLSSETMEELSKRVWQAPLRAGTPADKAALPIDGIVQMKINPARVAERMDAIRPILEDWLRRL